MVKTGAIQCEDYLEAKWVKVSGEKSRYEAIRETCSPKGVTIAYLSSKEDIPLFYGFFSSSPCTCTSLIDAIWLSSTLQTVFNFLVLFLSLLS